MFEEALATVTGKTRPQGSVYVVDPHPLNWLYITYNVVEELVRVNHHGHIEPAAMSSYRWVDDLTFEIEVRKDECFPDASPLDAATVKRSFDELMRWRAPHPPGTHFNLDPRTRCEVVDDRTVRFIFPQTDGLALGKLRAMHIMNPRFWDEVGFGYVRNGSGEGHW